ncbi:hypothetical protein [Pedobacter sp. SL55]|uniref:hypothetical protein n=1 Tax=Pedobacter sp. SL55 TaxID=2995161 RepID=UPI00226EA5A5|nr:hypothetical protein [Pedobacter sp. SL55]WAC41205.1 hypothetical protein OVA16_02180 [Pedobacter sp. SL55]
MMMIRFLLVLLIICQICSAQEKRQGNVDAMVNYVISKNMNRDALMASPEGMAYFFTITLVFNSEGKVDTGFYSKNLDKKVEAVMGLNASLIRKIKEQDVTYRTYASKVAVVPIFFFRRTDTGIDYGTGFIKAIQNLLPKDEPKLWGKSWVIFDPVINPFMKTH